MRTLIPCLLIVALAALPACQMNERLSGTVLGAVAGGAIGGATGGVGGAAIGLAAGGITGYLVGDYIADRRERGRAEVFGDATTTAPSAVMGVKEYANDDDARLAYERGRRALTAPEARAHFEKSIRLDPTQPAPYNALGLNALHRGERAEALRLFRVALQKDPGYYPAQYNLDRLLRAQD